MDELSHAVRGEVYFSPFTQMNDPFEADPSCSMAKLREFVQVVKKNQRLAGRYSSPTGSQVAFPGENPKIARANFKKLTSDPVKIAQCIQKNTSKLIQDIRRKHSLICLSEVPDSLLMWSHYAAGHKGVVIEYVFDEKEIFTDPFLPPIKVKYDTIRPSLKDIDIYKFACQPQNEDDEDSSNHVFNAIWLTKSADWSYEKEWRIISKDSSGYCKVSILRPAGLILGFGISSGLEKTIRSIWINTPIRRATLSKSDFSIVFS